MNAPATRATARVALVTYSTKPRGGVVHTLHLAEALRRMGQPVHIYALGDPAQGLYRSASVPTTIVPAPPPAGTLEERVFRNVDALAQALAREVPNRYNLVHVQDCISARAATRVRDSGVPITVLRTVHHVDDFTTPALVDCQRRSILEPDRVLVVSQHWRRLLEREYGVRATVVTNGVDADRFARDGTSRETFRAHVRAADRFLFLSVGGIEPRKGSLELIEAMAILQHRHRGAPPVLAVIGGQSFQDYSGYRDAVLGRAAELHVEVGRDLVLLGTVPDSEMPAWYHAADAFVFPSVKEGWGLAVLEALAAGLPVIATDIPVFREFLTPGVDALLVNPGDAGALAGAMERTLTDGRLRGLLAAAGPETARRFTWDACADQHIRIYQELAQVRPGPVRPT